MPSTILHSGNSDMNCKLWLAGMAVAVAACGSDKSGLQLGEERRSDDEAKNTAAMIDAIKAVSLQKYPDGIVRRPDAQSSQRVGQQPK